MGSIRLGFNLPVLCMFKYSLINVMSCCICFINDLILVWYVMKSQCKSKNLPAVNSDCMCVCMFNIVSILLSMVSIIRLILRLFSFMSSLEILVIISLKLGSHLIDFHINVLHLL